MRKNTETPWLTQDRGCQRDVILYPVVRFTRRLLTKTLKYLDLKKSGKLGVTPKNVSRT